MQYEFLETIKLKPMGILESAILPSLLAAPISILLNLLSSEIESSSFYTQPVAKQLWKRFYEAFFNSFELISRNELAKYTPEEIRIAKSIKQEIKIYVNDSNYLPLISVFQDNSTINFDNFLFKIRNDSSNEFKNKLAENLYLRLNLEKRIPSFSKEEVTTVLSYVFEEFYETFLSTLNNADQQRNIIEEIYTSRQELKEFSKICLEALTQLIESSPSKLTLELFKDLSKKNVIQYFRKEFSDLNIIIDREEEAELFEEIRKTVNPLIFLVGKSGVGKSLLCLKLLRNLGERDCVIWLDSRNIANSGSLEQAIDNKLKEIKSDVKVNYPDFFKLFGKQRLFIVVDDINRAENTISLVNKLISWRYQSNETKELPPFSIICPIWEKNYQSFKYRNSSAQSIAKYIPISFFSKVDACDLIKKSLELYSISSSSHLIEEIAKNINYDPFLVGIFINLINQEPEDILSLSKAPLRSFFEKHIDETTQDTYDFNHFEVNKCLYTLGELLLNNKKLNLNWSDLEVWFEGEGKNLKILRKIGDLGNLYKVNPNNGEIQFRHDRVRDELLLRKLFHWFQNNEIVEHVFKEVYYNELLSYCITKHPVPNTVLSFFYHNNPTVLFECIKFLRKCEKYYQNEIITLIKKWLKEEPNYEFIKPNIHEILARTISTDVINITEVIDYQNDNMVQFARFVNGDIISGLWYIDTLSEGQKYFLPATYKYHKIKKAIDAIKSYYVKKCTRKLSELLLSNNFGHQNQKYIIQLIGIFRLDSLGEQVFKFWKKSENKQDLLSSVIWMLLTCYKVKFSKYLRELLNFWKDIYVKDEKLDINKVYQDLRRINNWEDIPTGAIEELLTWIELEFPISKLSVEILLLLDNPIIVEALCFEPYFQEISFKDIFTYHDSNKKNCRYAWLKVSKQEKEKKPEFSRKSLSLYINAAESDDLPCLRKLHFEFYQKDAELFEKIAWKRLKLNDNFLRADIIKVIPELLNMDFKWCYYLPYIWNDEMWNILSPFLNMETFGQVSLMSFDLPTYYAEIVLTGCWNLILENQDFKVLNNALNSYIGRHQSRNPDLYPLLNDYKQLVQASLITQSYNVLSYLNELISKIDRPNPLFERIDYYFQTEREHISFNGWTQRNKLYLNREEIQILTPYVKYFEQHPLAYNNQSTLDKLAELSLAGENFDWVTKNVFPLLKTISKTDTDLKALHQIYLDVIPEGKHSINANLKYIYFPLDKNIIEEFNHYTRKGWYEMPSQYWIDSFKKRNVDLKRFFTILRKFLAQNSNINALKFAAKCI